MMLWRWAIFGFLITLITASLLFNAGMDKIDKDYGKGMCEVAFSLVTLIVAILVATGTI